MNIVVRQRTKDLLTASLVKAVAQDAISRIVKPKYQRFGLASVQIRIVNKVHGKKSTLGTAAEVKYGHYIMYLRRGLSKEELLDTIAHEVVHIDQFLDERLASLPGYFQWASRGKVNYFQSSNKTYDEYYNWPWEIEARAVATWYLELLKKEGKL